jgi:hypothetical protein
MKKFISFVIIVLALLQNKNLKAAEENTALNFNCPAIEEINAQLKFNSKYEEKDWCQIDPFKVEKSGQIDLVLEQARQAWGIQ